MITHKDDLRHTPTSEENFSESKWFSFYDQEHDFWVSSRIGLEPNKKKANRWLVAAFEGEIIHHDLSINLDLPGEDWDKISVGGLQYQTIEPMTRYRIKFNTKNMSSDLIWDAMTSVFDYEDCFAPLPPSLAAAHYEQSGKVKGTFSLSGKTYMIDGTGHRDHSWGVRHWEGFRSWIAFMGHFGHKVFFHVEQFHEQTTGVTRHGFVFSDGENVPLRDAKIKLEFSEDGEVLRHFSMELEDLKGKIFSITGEVRLGFPLTFGNCKVMESFGTFSSGGETTSGIIEYGFTR